MKWQGLHILPVEDWFPEALVKSATTLNEKIESQLTARREFDARDSAGGALAKADVIELNYGELLTLHSPRVELARILQGDLQVGETVGAWRRMRSIRPLRRSGTTCPRSFKRHA